MKQLLKVAAITLLFSFPLMKTIYKTYYLVNESANRNIKVKSAPDEKKDIIGKIISPGEKLKLKRVSKKTKLNYNFEFEVPEIEGKSFNVSIWSVLKGSALGTKLYDHSHSVKVPDEFKYVINVKTVEVKKWHWTDPNIEFRVRDSNRKEFEEKLEEMRPALEKYMKTKRKEAKQVEDWEKAIEKEKASK